MSLFQNVLQNYSNQKNMVLGNSLVVQWLGLGTFTAEGPGLITGQGTKIQTRHVAWPKKKTL